MEESAVNQRKVSKPEQNSIASEKIWNNAKKIYVEQCKENMVQFKEGTHNAAEM